MTSEPILLTRRQQLKATFSRLRQQLKAAISPGPRAWRGAAWGLRLVIIFYVLYQISTFIRRPAPEWLNWIWMVFLPFLAWLLGSLTLALLDLIHSLPKVYARALAALIIFLGLLSMSLAPLGEVIYYAAPMIAASLLGAGVASALRGKRQLGPGMTRRDAVAWGGLAVGAVLTIAGIAWLAWGGPTAPIPAPLPQSAPAWLAADLEGLSDPSSPGPYKVQTLTYGSGADRHRPEFGPDVNLRTKSVDGSKLVEGWDGPVGWGRTQYWGFDAKSLPLNARVWLPEGLTGPAPLVLMVHGNHAMDDFSDPGYAYLGELFASRGMIAVSVDENFLNGGAADRLAGPQGGLKEENDARGWLLLEHLNLWREWDKLSDHPLKGQADLERVALIGHSRGGEAVAIAAAFNKLFYYPDNFQVRFGYFFGIRSVIAIAPVDGQYQPAGVGTPLQDVSYLTLQGSMDGDMQSFHGSRQYERVTFSRAASLTRPYLFKSTVYIYGANHGQFNTLWGRADRGGFNQLFLNDTQIMPAADQQKIGSVFMSAFLEATLLDQPGYRAVFRHPNAAAAWLPEVAITSRYEDASWRYLNTYDQDLEIGLAALPGIWISGDHLSGWNESEVYLKWGPKDTRAAFITWDEPKASYAMTMSLSTFNQVLNEAHPDWPVLSAASVLVFSLADVSLPPKEGLPAPVDLTIELTDAAGNTASLPLNSFSALQPRVPAQVLKAAVLNPNADSEIVFQSFELPLSAFQAAAPNFDPAAITQIRFVFDRTEKGSVAIDNIGFYQAGD